MKSKFNTKNRLYYFIPIIIFSAIVPLIVYLKLVTFDEITASLLGNKDLHPDFFAYFKMIFILLSSVLGLAVIITRKMRNDLTIKRSYFYVFMIGYAILIIFSILMSEYKEISLIGFYNTYEGGLILLSYILFTFITINFANNEKHIEIILIPIIISATIIGVIGICQYFGQDLFQTVLGKNLIFSQKHMNLSNKLNIIFGKYTIYSTLSNSNFVGSYMAMMYPLSVGLFLFANSKRSRIFYGLFSCLMFASWIGCRSRAGLLGGGIALIILILIFRKKIIKNISSNFIYILSLILAFILMFIAPSGDMKTKLNTLKNADIGNVEIEKIIKDISIDGNTAKIKTDISNLTVILRGTDIAFKDTKGEEIYLSIDEESNNYILDYKDYEDYKIQFIEEDNLLIITIKDSEIRLWLNYKEGIKLVNYKGEIVDIKDIPTLGFKGQERFASSRGYIWSRTLPMIKDTIIIGNGPDTYPLYFPQDDIIGKYKIFGIDYLLINNPHNMYLQIATNTGLVSLILVVLMFLYYFVTSVKLYIKQKEFDKMSVYGISIFVAFCGYAIAGVFNDSVVSVAPVFWTLLGVGIAINLNMKRLFK